MKAYCPIAISGESWSICPIWRNSLLVHVAYPQILGTNGLVFVVCCCIKVIDHSLGVLLAQKNDGGTEQAIYYLSRILIGAESRYNLVKKECLTLFFAIQKMRHYLVEQTIHVISYGFWWQGRRFLLKMWENLQKGVEQKITNNFKKEKIISRTLLRYF